MDGERKKLIKAYWKRYRGRLDFNKQPVWRVPVRKPLVLEPGEDEMTAASIDTLDFAIESGTYDGEPSHRIVCEGIEVERWSAYP